LELVVVVLLEPIACKLKTLVPSPVQIVSLQQLIVLLELLPPLVLLVKQHAHGLPMCGKLEVVLSLGLTLLISLLLKPPLVQLLFLVPHLPQLPITLP
jgi:hypothetical protein